MGRRKERRLAAISAAGRRVKLDLFAEPSGDLGGSSAQEEVGGDSDSKTHAELPSSPSSSSGWLWYWEQSNGYQTTSAPAKVHYCVNFRPALPFFLASPKAVWRSQGIYPIGQQPQNPLLLLEQYSDEELDEGSNEGHNHAVAEDSSIGIDEQAKIAAGNETEVIENNDGKEPTVQKAKQLLMDNGSASQDPSQELEKGGITEIDPDDLQKQTNKTEEAAALDEHLVGDVSSGWKMVLHEESNQYYYWNIATGETSWEVPDVLAQETVTTSVGKVIGDTEGKKDDVMGTCKSKMTLDMEEDDNTIRKLNIDSKVNSQTSDSGDQGTKVDGSNEGFKGDSIDNEEGDGDANQSHGTSLLGRHSVENKSGTDLSSQLIKHCESLLERLNSVKGLNCYLEGQDLHLKYTLEIEIRLADIKALASHGSSLLPFWLHSEGQLKRLEAAVDGVTQRHNSAPASGFEAALESCEGISEKKALFPAVESHAEHITEKSNLEAHNDSATSMEHVPVVWYSSTSTVNDMGGKSEIAGTGKESELTHGPVLPSGEDVDMDVDMEVEDTTSIRSPHGAASVAHYHVSTELSNLHNTLVDQESAVPGQVISVAPPVEEWIPPPPPDNEPFPPPPPDDEPFPPPPPDEPPETSYPSSSHLAPVQPFPYSEQYTISYPGSDLEYYGQTNLEVPGSALYTHPEGGQVAHLPHYYEAVSNVYAVAPLVVNPVEPTAYYGLQNETLNPVSLISGTAESSATQSKCVPETLDSGTAGSLDLHAEDGSNLLLKTNLNVVKSGHGTVNVPPEDPDSQPSIGAPATSVTNGALVSSSSDNITSASAAAAAAAAAAATSKPQSKVSRSKKRTIAVVSSLRSNKKVSSLVDKWKAAKEALHEEEEEPEDAYDILEKKRQREIEGWRSQQIASGEAKDNANFQPLGGDWRERVKRRRAQKMKETKQSSSDVATDGNQRTDIVELSKGLPSGWQVYWDDSSKQVYYGNVWTSETTWSRPTD